MSDLISETDLVAMMDDNWGLITDGLAKDDFFAAAAVCIQSRIRAELKKLEDPNAVHLNMLRGGIAKPSWAQIEHLYPEEVAKSRSQLVRKTAALKAVTDAYNEAPGCANPTPTTALVWAMYTAARDALKDPLFPVTDDLIKGE